MLIQLQIDEKQKDEAMKLLKQFKNIIKDIKIFDKENEENEDLYKLQENSGFVKNILASSQEDVWNDV